METFESLHLRPEILHALAESGYETPTPIQISAVPALLEGRDVMGQAQTGTGKTAAFSLPMLQNMDFHASGIQALVLTPTRELAGQVSNTIYRYGQYLGVRVLAIYGGQSYDRQAKRLERAPHIIVGTPGRLLDLINRSTLDFSHVRYLVLDEADEMLKMGFIEDVEAILQSVPKQRQTALFSATFSDDIRTLAENYMHDPVVIAVKREQLTVALTEQRYYLVHEDSKLAALSRLLETEDMKSALIFTRTRTGSAELAEALLERGFTADALHGELNQAAREAVLRRFRNGQLPILVATDVVARGVDIQDVSHVFNFDIPYDPEDYVHRIGRTGRAGRSGIAITLVTPRERRRLANMEQFTKQRIAREELPLLEDVRAKRNARFVDNLKRMLEEDLQPEVALIDEMQQSGLSLEEIASSALRLARDDEYRRPVDHIKPVREDADRRPRRDGRDTGPRRRDGREFRDDPDGGSRGSRRSAKNEPGMVRLMLNVGREQGIRPGDVVGAIASEAGIPGKDIGAIDIQRDQTFVDVKEAHVERVLRQMRRSYLRGKLVELTRVNAR